MKVAIAQMNTTPGDFDAIVDKMCSYDTVAHAYGADLIVFPSTVMMGCDPLSLAQCPGYVLDFSSAMGALSERLTTPAIVPFVSGGIGPSMPEAALIRNGAVLPLLAVSNCTHKESYIDICITTCIIPLVSSLGLALIWGLFL